MARLRLKEGYVTISEYGVEVNKFLFYSYGNKKYYHIASFDSIVKKWVETVSSVDEATPESLCLFVQKYYGLMTVMTVKEVQHVFDFEKFIKQRK